MSKPSDQETGLPGLRSWRTVYTVQFEDAIYVLHAFQKKTNKTSQGDTDIARRRFGAVLKERKGK